MNTEADVVRSFRSCQNNLNYIFVSICEACGNVLPTVTSDAKYFVYCEMGMCDKLKLPHVGNLCFLGV